MTTELNKYERAIENAFYRYYNSLDLSQINHGGLIDDEADLRLTIEAISEKMARETGLYINHSKRIEDIIKRHKERIFTKCPFCDKDID